MLGFSLLHRGSLEGPHVASRFDSWAREDDSLNSNVADPCNGREVEGSTLSGLSVRVDARYRDPPGHRLKVLIYKYIYVCVCVRVFQGFNVSVRFRASMFKIRLSFVYLCRYLLECIRYDARVLFAFNT